MPTVLIRHTNDELTDAVVRQISKKLPKIVASALSCKIDKKGKLTEKDVAIELMLHGEDDINVKPISITIIANTYPERSKNLMERTMKILKAISEMQLPQYLQKNKISIWVQLVDGAYVTN
jgi:hypothetical protein